MKDMETQNDETCLTGACPPKSDSTVTGRVKLSEGSGGLEMHNLIESIRKHVSTDSKWKNTSDDSATFPLGDGRHLVFTTDSYVVTPIFFPGGDIGKIAFCGTVNDLSVMGAQPIGISLSLVIEEGFPKQDLDTILKTIGSMSRDTGIPIVTGDTKVMDKGAVDRMIINTSGVGIAHDVLDRPVQPGDAVIVSGGIGEHGSALIAKRFELETDIVTDSKPLHEEMAAIGGMAKHAKDITRGGLSSVLNEMSGKFGMRIAIDESRVPLKRQVRALTEILGLDAYSLACEGRLVCVTSDKDSARTLEILKRFCPEASIIGHIEEGEGVIAKTRLGSRMLHMPSGNIVPRIC